MRARIGAGLCALLIAAGCTSTTPAAHQTMPKPSTAAPSGGPASSAQLRVQSSVARSTEPSVHRPNPHPRRNVTRHPAARQSVHATTRPTGTALPLDVSTAGAQQVLTVVAATASSTTATLQAWQRGGSGWTKVGPAVSAYLGAAGIGQASESSSTTPTGSFTLTHAFGRDRDPGTRLPYVRTTPDDWWISQPGPFYNTRQRCSSGCGFAQGDPNEHLYYETPYYDYAVVIDYNTSNAPGGVRQGAGSAFFLHVEVGAPTEGCVSIPRDQLVRIMRWLDPREHPRILLGVA